jgi:hypothetical protein
MYDTAHTETRKYTGEDVFHEVNIQKAISGITCKVGIELMIFLVVTDEDDFPDPRIIFFIFILLPWATPTAIRCQPFRPMIMLNYNFSIYSLLLAPCSLPYAILFTASMHHNNSLIKSAARLSTLFLSAGTPFSSKVS